MTTPILRLLGFRGTSLAFLALVWFAVGARIANDPDPDPTYMLLVEWLPVEVRVALWWVPALVAFIVAWLPTRHGKFGFVALVIPAAIRAFSFTIASPWHPELRWDALVWVGVVGYILTVSAWPEPARRYQHRPDGPAS